MWTRNVKVLCGVSFLQDAASELLYPILPIFLTVTLGAPVAVVGAVEGIAEGAASAMKLIAGRLADRWPRRPLIAFGYGLAALGKVLIALATSWPLVLAGRGVDRVGKGIRGAPRDVLLVEGVPAAARGRVFGAHRAADTAGAVVGPLIGLGAYEALGHHIRPLLILAVIPALLSVALVAAVRETPTARSGGRPARGAAGRQSVGTTSGFGWGGLSPQYRRVVTMLAVFSLVNFPDALLLLRVHELGYGVPGVIGAYVVYNASYAVLSYPAGALADRWPKPRVYALGLLCFAAGYGGLALVSTTTAVIPLLIIYGGFAAATDGVGKAWISTLVPAEAHGRAQGLFQSLSGAGVLIAGIWAGLAWNGDGRIPLLISAGTALTLALALPFLTRPGPTPGAAALTAR